MIWWNCNLECFFYNIQTAVYTAARFVIQWNFSDLKNPRFIIKSGFKSRAGYNGARTVYLLLPISLQIYLQFSVLMNCSWICHRRFVFVILIIKNRAGFTISNIFCVLFSRWGPNFIHLHQGPHNSSVGGIFKKKIECCISIWNSKVLICILIWTQWLLGTLKHTGGSFKRNETYENHATFSAFAWIKCQDTLTSFYSIS